MCRLLLPKSTLLRIVSNRHQNQYFIISSDSKTLLYPLASKTPVKEALRTGRSAYLCKGCQDSDKINQKALSKQVSRALKRGCPDDIVNVLRP